MLVSLDRERWVPSVRVLGACAAVLLAAATTACSGGSESAPPPGAGPLTGVSAPAGEDVTVAAVGDMNPEGNTSPDSASGKNAAAITAGLRSGDYQAFLALGDFQYEKGTCSALTNSWMRLWGDVVIKTYFTTGPNHDVEPGENDDVDRFLAGQCPGAAAKSQTAVDAGGFRDALDPYAFDIGNWHVVVLPTALWRYDPDEAEAATAWLDQDLTRAVVAGKHLAAMYHDPIFTGVTESHGPETDLQPWIDVLYEHRVRLTLSGSQHNYERTHPVDADGERADDGMTAFQVSTGGVDLRELEEEADFVAESFTDTWGYLVLTLKADGSFSWRFEATSGDMKTDRGERAAP